MTNDFDNENEDFVDSDADKFDHTKRSGPVGNITEAWNTRPLFKFMALVFGIFAVVVAAFKFFGGGDGGEPPTMVRRPPAITEAPGGVSTPTVQKHTIMASEQRAREALATGASAMPTPLGEPADLTGIDGLVRKEDPLRELRAETELLKRQMRDAQKRPPEPFDNSLAAAMQKQMLDLLQAWGPSGITVALVTENYDNAVINGEPEPVIAGKEPARKVLVRAGTVSYAQLLTEANSDVPGPILAQIVSGPLAGARIIGSFQTVNSYDKYLVMRFNRADKDGKDYAISAIALDPDTTLGGMATEVDERYFARVILPSAAAFLSGLGSAIGSPDQQLVIGSTATIVTQSRQGVRDGIYSGLGRGAETIGQFFQQQANVTKPLVRVAAGTPMGIFFLTPAYDMESVLPEQFRPAMQPLGEAGYGDPAAFRGQQAATGRMPSYEESVPYPNYATRYYGYQGYQQGYPAYQQGYGGTGFVSQPPYARQ